jgi:hypothetical protein
MRNRLVALCLALVFAASFVFALAAPAHPAAAQDMEPVVCDSTLVLLLYVAEHDYGFESMYDVSTLEKGQYASLFDSMMAMTESMESTAEPMMEATPDMMTEEPMGDEMMTTLTPGTIAGEPELCTQVRGEVESFLVAKFAEGAMQ